MTQKTFIAEYTQFIQLALSLADKSQQQGIESLEGETENLADEFFKQGLRFVVGGFAPRLIDEIMTNRIAHEKDKRTRLYKTIQKRAVIGIQAGEPPYILYHVFNSLAGLQYHEENKIWEIIFLDDIPKNKEGETK